MNKNHNGIVGWIWNNKFLLLLMVQIIALFLYNLTQLHMESNYDSSAAYAQAMEVWNQKTLFIKNWDYQSTGGLDSLLPLAALLYGITNNIFLSYGIADCLGTLLFLYIVSDLGKRLHFQKDTVQILCILLLTPYTLGQLGYLPMMFTGAAYYIFKALLPLLLIDLLFRLNQKEHPWFLYLIYFWLLFFTGFSCGLYLLLCGIFPVLLWELWNHRNKSVIVLSSVSLILMFLGIIFSKMYGLTSFTNRMVLCNASNFIDNCKRWFVGIFELFGGIPYGEVSVTSLTGIAYVARMGIVIVLLISMIAGIVLLIKRKDKEKIYEMGFFLSVIAINTIVLLLCYTTYGSSTYEYSYHLIPAMGMLFIAAFFLDQLCYNMRKPLYLSAFIVLMIGNIVGYSQCYNVTSNYSQCKKIVSSVKDEKIELIYYIDDQVSTTIDARNARLVDSKVKVISGSSYGEFDRWGASTEFFDLERISALGHNVAYIFTEASYRKAPEDVRSKIIFHSKNDKYMIYYSK